MRLIGVSARFLVLMSLMIAPALSRAQSFTFGAEVFLFQPGATITSTLLAAPAAPTYNWSAGIFYLDGGTAGTFLHSGSTNNMIGVPVTPAASPLPSQNGLPLVFAGSFVNHSDIPPGGGQHENIPIFFSTTGFRAGNFVPTGASPTAGVVFGPNRTAQIGFAPAGMSIGSFVDFPIRIRVTNVFDGRNGC